MGWGEQHSCSRKSCLTNLLLLYRGFHKHMGERDPVDTRNMAFQKTFDKILQQKVIKFRRLL